MSAMNSALSELAKEKSSSANGISRAEVAPVKQRAVLPWVVGSFGLSLAVGGWAISQQAPYSELDQATTYSAPVERTSEVASPTTKVVTMEQPLYHVAQSEVDVDSVSDETTKPQAFTVSQSKASSPVTASPKSTDSKPVLVAKVDTPPKQEPAQPVNAGEVVIKQVELTPQQLSEKAQERAKKALDSNNLAQALKNYNEALRYTPSDSNVRQRLSALYYGKGEVRKAAEILQKGIALEPDNASLRLSLAKMLMKENQGAAALTVLSVLPNSASIEYVSLRAALAQKNKQDALALESYEILTNREPESGRWWLGFAIQQERAFNLEGAKYSYQQALNKFGLSNQSQQFIRDRLTLISQLEEQPSEN